MDKELLCNNIYTPIIIFDSDGVVVFKNDAAVSWIKRPHRNVRIGKYISKESKPLFDMIMNGETDYGLVSFSEYLFYKKAYLRRIEYLGKSYGIMIFHYIFQVPHHDVCKSLDTTDIYLIFEKIIDRVMEQFGRVIERKKINYNRIQRIKEYVNPILSELASTRSGGYERYRYNLRNTVDFITDRANSIFKKCGYRLAFDSSGIDEGTMAGTDVISFALTFLHVIQFILEISSDKTAHVSFSTQDRMIHAEISAAVSNAGLSALCESNISLISNAFPSEYLNFAVYEGLMKKRGWTADFDMDDSDNGRIVFRTHLDTAFCADSPVIRNAAWETQLLIAGAKDTEKLLSEMFIYYEAMFTNVYAKQ